MERLTIQEEEAMQCIWKLNGGFVKDILEEMQTDLPYTTLASTIKKLEQKKYVRAEKLGNANFYAPIITEKNYKRKFMKSFVSDYFKDSYKEVVNFFVEEDKLSDQELEEIIDIIKQRKSK